MKILHLEGNIQGEWKRLHFDLEPFPEGPTKDRLLQVHGMTERGERPSDGDVAFCWEQALQLERIYPEGLLHPE